MNKLIKKLPYLGAFIVAISFVAEFVYLFLGDDEMAKVFLMIIPFGFLILFVGVVTNMLSR